MFDLLGRIETVLQYVRTILHHQSSAKQNVIPSFYGASKKPTLAHNAGTVILDSKLPIAAADSQADFCVAPRIFESLAHEFVNTLQPLRHISMRHRTARRIAPLMLSQTICSGSCARTDCR